MDNSKNILVVGDFLAGSNTIINCLLDSEILKPSNKILHTFDQSYTYSTANKITVTYKINETKNIEFSELDKYRKLLFEKILHEDFEYINNAECITGMEFLIESDFLKLGITITKTYKGLFHSDKLSYGINEMISNASIIIVVLNASRIFSLEEKSFIQENFANQGLRNVFFVINRINYMHEDIEYLVKCVEKNLESVFSIDENFDIELYNKRVFYIDALGALQAKQKGDIEAFHKTGFAKFENILTDTILFGLY